MRVEVLISTDALLIHCHKTSIVWYIIHLEISFSHLIPHHVCMAKGKSDGPRKRFQPRGIDILHEDRDILVVSKASGLLTVDDGRDSRTAYSALTDYVKKGQARSKNRIFIVHRIDRETSGILVFAKTEEVKSKLQLDWDNTQKTYLAIVDGTPEKEEGSIISYLTEAPSLKVYSTKDKKEGKRSETKFKVIKPIGENRSLLELNILTGRKHQIRVHMADAGHPVVGDIKYGKRIHGNRSIALHAFRLTFDHPFSGETMTFEAPVPPNFYGLGGLIAQEEKPKATREDKIEAKKERNKKKRP